MKDFAASPVRKHSVEIATKPSSVSLEDEFWEQLRLAAAARGMTMESLVTEVDAQRAHKNRSSALRIYALRWTLR
jgi:predicted DNA-binding ribbon-helix-helix protein